METRQIEYFLRIAELGSINKAADDLRMSQPSLSRLISQLEHEIGTALFMRTRRGVHLRVQLPRLRRAEVVSRVSELRANL